MTLSVDQRLMAEARKGCSLSNFILAHEFAHLALGHHARSATTPRNRVGTCKKRAGAGRASEDILGLRRPARRCERGNRAADSAMKRAA